MAQCVPFRRELIVRRNWSTKGLTFPELLGTPRTPTCTPAIRYNEPMNQGRDQRRVALSRDVTYIYGKGFHPMIAATSIPALADLAEALSPAGNDGKDDYCRQVVEALLHRAIDHLSTEVRAGVASLLGIDEPDKQTVGVRRNRAAEHLGYKSGESLRKATRRGNYIEALLGDVVDQLLALQSEAGLSPEAHLTPAASRSAATSVPMRAADIPDAATRVQVIVLGQFQKIHELGTEKAVNDGHVPVLTSVAEFLYPSAGTTLEKTEALLTWVIGQHASDSRELLGMLELAELGKKRDLKRDERHRRAASHFGDGMNMKSRELVTALFLSEPLCKLLREEGVTSEPSHQ